MVEVLVIIDMQKNFKASRCKRTTQNIIRLIKEFKKKKNNILIVEYSGENATRWDIVKAIGSYNHRIFVNKNEDDGAKDIQLELCRNGYCEISDISFILCGVNFGACVLDTAVGLRKRFPNCKVNVVEEACNDDNNPESDYWKQDKKYMVKNSINVC